MATTKPRITVTLTERQHEVLRSLSRYSGQSMSAYMVEFLDLALPTLERMAVTMQAMAQARESEIERVRVQLDQAQQAFEPLAAAVVAQTDLFWGRVEAAAAGAGGREPHAPAARGSSPPTNRGVTPTPSIPPKSKRGKASGAVGVRSKRSKTKGVENA